jgi:hypothetical protein
MAINGWIDIEMVKTFSSPLSQQQNPERVGPIRKPGLDLLENDEVKTKRPSMWNIVFYNDVTNQLKIPPATRFARNSTPQRNERSIHH